MQGDGNLVVYSSAGTAPWDSGTNGHAGASLVLNDGGLEIIYQGTVIWSSETTTATIVVTPATPTVTWADPARIISGTPPSPARLDATANVPGTFAGRRHVAGRRQQPVPSATFVPTDYKGVLATATINVLPVTPGPAGSANLSTSYNQTGIYAGGTSYPNDGGFDGNGYAYSGNQLGRRSPGTGAVRPRAGRGRRRGLGGGPYDRAALGGDSQLPLLGAAVNGDQPGQTFTVHYADGTMATFRQGFSDRYTPQGDAGESIAATMPHRDTAAGAEQALSSPFNLHGYAEPLEPGKAVVSLTLSNDPDVEILAMDLVNANSFAIPFNNFFQSTYTLGIDMSAPAKRAAVPFARA